MLGLSGLTVVGQTPVTVSADGEPVGVPDLNVYDKAGRVVLCMELKTPGKGADPNNFKEEGDKDQWKRYRLLPNVIYTDGNRWSLWHSGQRAGRELTVCDNIKHVAAPVCVDGAGVRELLKQALTWQPPKVGDALWRMSEPLKQALTWQPPKVDDLQKLASTCANYCRMLRDAVSELPKDLLEHISSDWSKLLFPDLKKTVSLTPIRRP